MPTTGAGRVLFSGDNHPVPSGPWITGSGVRTLAVPKKPPLGANTPPSWATIVYGRNFWPSTCVHAWVAGTGTVTRVFLESPSTAAFIAAVVAGVLQMTGAVVLKHNPRASAFQ